MGASARWSRRGRCAARCTCCAPTSCRSTSARRAASSRATSRSRGSSTSSSPPQDVQAHPRPGVPAALRDGPLTREELAERVHAGPRPRLRRPAQAGRVPRRADLRASEGQNVRFALPEPFERMDAEEATRELARRFLTRYGPATREELAKWFGAPVAAPRRALDQGARRRGGRDRVRLGARRATSRRSRPRSRPASSACCPRSTSTSSPRRATTRATTAPERIYRPGGWFSPVLLVDGVMAGVWALRGRRGDDRAVRARSARPCARPPRPRPRGCPVRRRVSWRS